MRGTCSMARTSAPHSANSQFFICFGDARFLDKQYSVWGKVTEGMDVVDQIKRGEPVRDPDTIVSIEGRLRRLTRRNACFRRQPEPRVSSRPGLFMRLTPAPATRSGPKQRRSISAAGHWACEQVTLQLMGIQRLVRKRCCSLSSTPLPP